jgi:NAD(P)H-hydrate epimerase
MLKVLTAAQMREVDRLTTERYGIPSILLMENAAHAVARVITEKLGGSVKGRSILILCGPGNNGGDGAALARVAANSGAEVTAILVGEAPTSDGDAGINFRVLADIARGSADAGVGWYSEQAQGSIEILRCDALETWQGEEIGERRSSADVLVDALFGTGLHRPLDGIYSEVAKSLAWELEDRRSCKPLIVAVDIPSGLDADESREIGPHACADVTVTFTAPKRSNVLPGTVAFGGELIVADIGSPASILDALNIRLEQTQQCDLTSWLWRSQFTNASYKNKRGHALVIGGSRDYSGAAVLSGDAAIRSGCGLVTVATPEGARESIVARVSPEVMVRGLSETESGSVAEKAADEIAELLKNVDAVAIGSGLSLADETKAFVRRVVAERQTPVVIDADGLTALSPWAVNGAVIADDDGSAGESPAFQSKTGESPAFQSMPLILTPHEGEFKRLLGVDGDAADDALKDRVHAVRDFVTKNNVILVLKGERVLIGAPDGRVVVNPTGNSGLGKAGNGDTLTGILVGFVAQATQMKIDIFEAVVAAVYIAGMAGDVAEQKYGKRVMTASDVRDCLVDVLEKLTAT